MAVDKVAVCDPSASWIGRLACAPPTRAPIGGLPNGVDTGRIGRGMLWSIVSLCLGVLTPIPLWLAGLAMAACWCGTELALLLARRRLVQIVPTQSRHGRDLVKLATDDTMPADRLWEAATDLGAARRWAAELPSTYPADQSLNPAPPGSFPNYPHRTASAADMPPEPWPVRNP